MSATDSPVDVIAENKNSDKIWDRSSEDVGNVQLLEHVNLTVPDQNIAALFYVTGLGFTRDPYIDFGTYNMWVNVGEQQFHLPTNTAQVLRGHVAIVVPDLEDLARRLAFAARGLSDTRYACHEVDDHLRLSCPYGNSFRAFEPDRFSQMGLGIPYVEFDVPAGSSEGIARFYSQVLGAPATAGNGAAVVAMGHNQQLRFVEVDAPLVAYDGHHIAIYVADFSGPHRWLRQRGLISEESDQYQYRFQQLVDPDSGAVLYELEHEVRSLSHAMYRRPLVNRNPANSFFSYQRGNERYAPTHDQGR